MCFAFLASCGDSDELVISVPLQVTNPEIIPIGEIEIEDQFSLTLTNDTAKCIVRTIRIYENDTISSINAYLKDKTIHITINASPNGIRVVDNKWVMLPPDKWVHDIKFNLIGIRKQRYGVTFLINSFGYEKIIMDLGNTDFFSTNF